MRAPVAAFLILASCTSQPASDTQPVSDMQPAADMPSPTEQVAALLPGLRIGWQDTTLPGGVPYGLLRFGYTSEGSDWPYGTGLAVLDRTSEALVWVYQHHGSFGPHTFEWADFDGDGRQDLFLLAGFEDVFQTHIYLNRIASSQFGLSNFAIGYRNDEMYAVVMDFDGDSLPELLIHEPRDDEDSIERIRCGGISSFDDLAAEVTAEYERLVGTFDRFNYKYGVASYPVINMFVTNRIRIRQLHTRNRWVTKEFKEHLRWRLDVLDRFRSRLAPECLAPVDSTRSYLMNLLGR